MVSIPVDNRVDSPLVDDEPAPERIGEYIIERCLGVGGMAKVYLARHAVLDSRYAIKVLDPSYRANPAARQRFLDEAKIQAGQLDHPNIVKVVNIVATTEHAALVMELIDGPSLESRVGDLENAPAEIRTIMLAVLDAVGYAHDKGIIHRDLKPANVLLAKRGNQVVPKVTDFGIAKIASGGSAKKSTHADARMGTLTYSSPEQLRSPKDVTPRSDVFSLGAMLYELATGQIAFPGENDYDVMDAIIKGRYVPPEQHHASIDPVIAAVIRKALEPDPAKRFASCQEMADALTAPAAVVAAPPPPAVPSPVSPPALHPTPPSHTIQAPLPLAVETSPRGRTGLWLGLGAVVVAGGVVAMIASRGGKAARVADAPRDAGVCMGDAAICTSPPVATCVTPTTLRTFGAVGTCSAATGACSYASTDSICGGGCSNASCDPQVGGGTASKDSHGSGGLGHGPGTGFGVGGGRARKPSSGAAPSAASTAPSTAAPAKCDAESAKEKGMTSINEGQHAAALAQFEASLRCKDDPYVVQLAFMQACASGNSAKAKQYYPKLTLAQQTKFAEICKRQRPPVAYE